MSIPTLYNIPAHYSFVDVFATGLLKQYEETPEALSKLLILLPTRRACRVLRDSFLKHTQGKPLLLPRMCPFGDIDEEELFISSRGNNVLDIPPALSALNRQILLARTISGLPDFSKSLDQDMALAKMLGQLMDQIYTEDLDLSELPNLVDAEEFQAHWQITVRFLSILSEVWPSILTERDVIDAADRRNRLINALTEHWKSFPPSFPVIAAGSTGSIPATTNLLHLISELEQGSVVLPALDQQMDEDIWAEVVDGHPQATLKNLIEQIGVRRAQVELWPYCPKDQSGFQSKKIKQNFLTQLMYPADKTDQWQKINLSKDNKKLLEEELANISLYECPTPNDEALLIALIMRETLEEKEKIAALVTADRNLARRVAMACKRWGIDIDDSGGTMLSDTPIGQYLRLCALSCLNDITPVSLLALLKHELCRGAGVENFRGGVRVLEKEILRGLKPENSFEGLYQRIRDYREQPYNKDKDTEFDEAEALLKHLEPYFNSLCSKMTKGAHSFLDILDAHIMLAEQLANGADDLWSGEAGEAAASFLSELRLYADQMLEVTGQNYFDVFEQLLSTVTVRPKFGTHPRLMILGQLEARLLQADRVILGGLNEGSWPPNPGHDPWMSRPMRGKFGLPTPERGIGLSAHDFVQAVSASDVIITRATRVEGTPTVPARWLARMDTLLDTLGINKNVVRQGAHLEYVRALDHTEQSNKIERPAPQPPLEARPRKLSVTRIETWLKDPYSIYARSVLRLKKLEELEKLPEASEKGMLLHDVLEKFVTKHPRELPIDAEHQFIVLSKEVLAEHYDEASDWHFWSPRMVRLADWFVGHERAHRQENAIQKLEADGEIAFTPSSDIIDKEFYLTARADRIDKRHDGTGAVIIDYKSGGAYSLKGMITGKMPQLPLEALMIERGGFSGVQSDKVASLEYWKLTGGRDEGDVTQLAKSADVEQAVMNAEIGLLNLIRTFDDLATPYYSIPNLDNAPRFNDYEHLARVKEWTALGEADSSGEAA